MADRLSVLVLGGGPDRERPVSLRSAAAVAAALRQVGHDVVDADITPADTSILKTPSDVVFPALHGRWGEGGPLQRLLDEAKLRYVGCRPRAAYIAIDKCASKQVAEKHGVRTPEYQQLGPRTPLKLELPVVLKPLTEGSTFGVEICRSAEDVAAARERLHAHYAFVLAERFTPGREVTVGILDQEALPPIQIIPKEGFYDFDAKYQRSDTTYQFDTGLDEQQTKQLQADAWTVHQKIGCRHLSRVDFMVDAENRWWFLEINTMPGFTDHSLLPMAAAKAGVPMTDLCDRLVRLAMRG